jgi:serine/threonine protein kinase
LSSTSGSHAAEPPRLLADRYEVIEVIGTGASAVTWRGYDRRLERPVAIKILRRGGHQNDPAWLQRFEREARLAASVTDPHVVQVYDVGQEEGWPFLVMQYIEGQDLKALIDERAPLPVARAEDIALQILAGLESIHQTGILHRDIKPQNVLLDRQGRVRVTDFGIAQGAFDPDLTADGLALGTASYMAPEQARGETLSEATDVYAVGVVLYEMLTGRLPFERTTPMATMLAHIEDEPLAPSAAAPREGISPRLDGVVLQAMAKAPRQRFTTATAMARALEGATQDGGATTRLPAADPNRTMVSPQRPRNPVTVRPPADRHPPPPAAPPPTRQGGGRGPLTFLLTLILLAMIAVAAYLAWEVLDLGGNGDEQPPQQTNEVAPTETQEPTLEPTEEIIVAPTSEPTSEPPPTATQEPTAEPTSEPPTVTQEPPLIEPVETFPPTEETLPPTEEPIIEPAD